MSITSEQKKILHFPKKRSAGSLYYAPIDQPEEWELLTQVRGLVVSPENEPIHWELLDEARGEVVIPDGVKLKLKISSDGEGLAALEELDADDLHALDLGHTSVVDHALIYIQHLTGLRFLELNSTSLGDHGLSFVRGLHNLHSIGLSYSRVTNEGLSYLRDLKELREIWLSGAHIDDLGLELLSGLEQLVQMGLSSTLVTDAGLLNLVKLKKLLRIYLYNTRVTHNGTQLLKSLIPGCKVKWHPPKIHTRDAEQTNFVEPEQQKNMIKSVSSSKFTEEDFWQIIHLLNWQAEGEDTAVIEPAINALAKLEIQDIFQFAEILAHKLYLLDGAEYAQEIGIDAYAGNKGNFSKNWFLYMRCCVIANGEDFYLSVLKNPKRMPKDIEFQALLTIAPQAYKLKTGERFNYVTKYNYETFNNKGLWVDK